MPSNPLERMVLAEGVSPQTTLSQKAGSVLTQSHKLDTKLLTATSWAHQQTQQAELQTWLKHLHTLVFKSSSK